MTASRSLAPILPMATLLWLASSAPLAQKYEVLLEEEQVLGDVGRLTEFDQLAVNNHGSFLLDVPVFRHGPLEALLLNGAPLLVQGAALAAPVGATFRATRGTLGLNNFGSVGLSLRLDGTSGKPDRRALYWNTHLLARSGDPIRATAIGGVPLTPGTTYQSFQVVLLNDRDQLLVVGQLNDPTFPSPIDFAAIHSTDGAGNLLDESLLAVTGFPLPATGEIVDGLTTLREYWDLNGQGDWIGEVQIGAQQLVLMNGQEALRTGSESPAHPGRNLSVLVHMDLNSLGDFAMLTYLDGEPATNTAIVVNATDVMVTEGDTFPAIAPYRVSRFDGAPIRITRKGDVFWYCQTTSRDSSSNRCYLRSTQSPTGAWTHQVLVQNGTTQIGQRIASHLRTDSDAFDVSDNGRFWLGEVGFSGIEAIVSIDFGSQDSL